MGPWWSVADLITHACLALLLKRGQRALRPATALHLSSFAAGSVLPDLLGRLPAEVFSLIQRHTGPLPPLLLHGWEPFHLPVGMVITSVGLAALFTPRQRLAVFSNLLAGMLLHLGVDLLQDHAGAGYLLLYPLSTRPYELGLIGTELTVWLVPGLVAATALAWWGPARRRFQPRATGAGD